MEGNHENRKHKDKDPAPSLSGEPKIEWAKHLWEEWRYRHETWHKTFYRSLSFVVTLAIIPWIPKELKGIESTFPSQPVIEWAYALLPLVLFLATAFQLASEHTHLIEIEDKLQQTRDGESGDKYSRPNRGMISVFVDKRPNWFPPIYSAGLYLAIGIALWAFWSCATFYFIPLVPCMTRQCGSLK